MRGLEAVWWWCLTRWSAPGAPCGSAGRDPPRRAGNFHSPARMKVTKARGLNAGDFPGGTEPRTAWHAGFQAGKGAGAASLRRSTRPAQPGLARHGRRLSTTSKPARHAGCSPDATVKMAGVGPFALVTFIWALQMKVTRPPGRIPGRLSSEEQPAANDEPARP